MKIAFTENFSIHYSEGRLTIFDERMNKHLPFSFGGAEAREFIKTLDELEKNTPDDIAFNKAIDNLCETMKAEVTLRPQ